MEVSEIIESIDMGEYISQFVDLEERGRELWGLSPFKEERTPSFSVDTDKQYWYDFSIGAGGNLIDFIVRYKNVSVYEAVQELKAFGHIIESQNYLSSKLEATKIAKRYRSMPARIAKSTAKPLPDDYMDHYAFDKEHLRIWKDEGISYETMWKFGVRYDFLDDRIVYPIKDYEGRITSVCGRTTRTDYKEKRIPKYTYLQSIGTIDTILCFSDNKTAILNAHEIILFEGLKSIMKAYEWGYENCGALLTSHLSDNQFRFLVKLSNFHNVRIVFALDSDIDITKDKNIQKLMSYARVEWVCNRNDVLPPKDSPVDKGKEIWDDLYKNRRKMN